MENVKPDRENPRFQGIIRQLKEEDIPSLIPILETWIRVGGKIDQVEIDFIIGAMKGSLDGTVNRTYFVAQTLTDQVVGMGGLNRDPVPEIRVFAQTDNPVELVNLFVAAEYRMGKGVGSTLTSALESRAKQDGHTEIILESGPRYEKSSYPFYDKIGFERVGIIEDRYGPGLHTQVFRKPIF